MSRWCSRRPRRLVGRVRATAGPRPESGSGRALAEADGQREGVPPEREATADAEGRFTFEAL